MPGRQTSARKRGASTAELSDQENTRTRSSRLTRLAAKDFIDDEAEEDNEDDDFEEVGDGDGDGEHEDGELQEEGDDCDVPLLDVIGEPQEIARSEDDANATPTAVDDDASNVAGSTEKAVNGSSSLDKPADDSATISADRDKETASKDKKDTLVQTNLNAHVQAQDAHAALVPPEDAVPSRASFTKAVLKRFNSMFKYSNPDEATYYIRQEPDELIWSSKRVKGSSLMVTDNIAPLRLWSIGDLSWNGLLPDSNGAFPTRAKLSITPLRSGDLMRFRQLVQKYSKTKKELEISNITSVSAHSDMASRSRGSNSVEAKPFPHIYDGREIFSPDKEDMRVIPPNTLVRGDVVLMEMTVSRYWDDSEGGRVKDWDSTRVYFHLQAVTLLVNAEDAVEVVAAPPPKPKKKIVL